jgi:hypothetical protein
VLVGHRLIPSRPFRSLFDQSLANLVRVDDRFFERKAILTPIAMLNRWRSPANVAVPIDNRLGHHLDDRLWRLLLFSVNLPEVLDPCQIPLGPSRDFLRVPEQN